jgi:hypothetical protein
MNPIKSTESKNQHNQMTMRLLRLIGGLTAAVIIACGSLNKILKAKDYNPDPVGGGQRETFYGFYNDLNYNKSFLENETLKLNFRESKETPGIELIEGRVTGQVVDQVGEKVDRTWGMSGYKVGDRLVLSYFTESPDAQGAGVYILRASGTAYVGYWLGKDAITGQTIQGPYVLMTEPEEAKDVEKEYPELSIPAKFADVDAQFYLASRSQLANK